MSEQKAARNDEGLVHAGTADRVGRCARVRWESSMAQLLVGDESGQ